MPEVIEIRCNFRVIEVDVNIPYSEFDSYELLDENIKAIDRIPRVGPLQYYQVTFTNKSITRIYNVYQSFYK